MLAVPPHIHWTGEGDVELKTPNKGRNCKIKIIKKKNHKKTKKDRKCKGAFPVWSDGRPLCRATTVKAEERLNRGGYNS